MTSYSQAAQAVNSSMSNVPQTYYFQTWETSNDNIGGREPRWLRLLCDEVVVPTCLIMREAEMAGSGVEMGSILNSKKNNKAKQFSHPGDDAVQAIVRVENQHARNNAPPSTVTSDWLGAPVTSGQIGPERR